MTCLATAEQRGATGAHRQGGADGAVLGVSEGSRDLGAVIEPPRGRHPPHGPQRSHATPPGSLLW